MCSSDLSTAAGNPRDDPRPPRSTHRVALLPVDLGLGENLSGNLDTCFRERGVEQHLAREVTSHGRRDLAVAADDELLRDAADSVELRRGAVRAALVGPAARSMSLSSSPRSSHTPLQVGQ